jgi:hypothetical protein
MNGGGTYRGAASHWMRRRIGAGGRLAGQGIAVSPKGGLALTKRSGSQVTSTSGNV